MPCSSCGKNRNELSPKKSRLMPSVTLLLCNVCIEKKNEPRYLVILFGRAQGIDAIADYIKSHRYCGADITASELV